MSRMSISESDDDSQKMFSNYGSESKIKTSGGDEPYSPSAPTDPTDTWSPKGLAKHMSAYSDIFEDPEVDPTEGSSSGSGGARPKNTLKPRSTSMTDNRSPPRGGNSGVKRKSDVISDSESDDDHGHLQEDSDGDSDSSDFAPSAATCAICLGKMRGAVGSPNVCEHTFCIECILEWSNNNATCPQDRKSFNLILVRDHLDGTITSKLPVELPPEQPAEAFEESPTYCEICNECDREDRLLLCDGCDMGYHLECLTPPLSTVPIEEWFCPVCIAADLPQSALGSIWEQRSSTEAGPSSSSSGSRGSRSSQSEARSSHSRESRVTSRPRLIPRTQATERVRKKIIGKKKVKRAKRAAKRRKKAEKMKKVMSMEHDNKLHRWGKDSEGADVDADYNSDDDAQKILDGNLLQKHFSSLHSKERQEEKRANAAKVIREGFFTPRPSYVGSKTSVVTRVALAPRPSASSDILGDIFESQSIAFGSSKNLTLTGDRKLQPKDPKKFEEVSFAKDIPLPSQKSSTSTKEGTHSPSRNSKSKYNLSPRSSKRSPSPRNSRRSPSPKISKRSPSPRSSKRSPSPKISKRTPSPKKSKRSPSPRISKRSPSPRSSKRSPSPRSSKRSPSPRSSRRSSSPRNSKRSSSPKKSKHSPSPKHSKRSPSPRNSKRSSSPKSSRRSPSSRNYKRTPSPRGYKKRSPSPKMRRSSQDYKREYSSRTDRSRDDKYYSPLETRNRSPPKLSYGNKPVSSRRERDRKRSYSPEERGYKQDYRKGKHYSPRHRRSKESLSPETLYLDRPERERSPYRKEKTRDTYRDTHRVDKVYGKRERSPQRKERSPYREKSPHRREYSPIREKSPQRRERSPYRDRSPRRRELSPRRDSSPYKSRKSTHGTIEAHSREKIKVKERSQWSHSYYNSNGTDLIKSNSNSYSVHSVQSVHSSSKSHKGEISKRDSSQDSSDDKSKTSRSSSKESSSSDSSSDSSSSESEKDSEEEAREQQSLHSIGNLMMSLKNKKKVSDKGKRHKKESKKEKSSEGKRKKVSSQHSKTEIDSDSSRKESKKQKINNRKSFEEALIISDDETEDEQPIQTINKLKIVPRPSKHKSSSKNTESKRKKHSKRRHKSLSSSSSSNSESDSSDTDEEFGSKSDKEKSKGKFKNIGIQKVKDNIKDDVGGSASIGEKKISISLKDNFSIKINKKNALGIDEEPTKKLSGLPDKEAEEDKFSYNNPYEKKRVSHFTPEEEKQKLVEVDKKSVSSLYERTSLVLAAANEEKDKEESIKSSDKRKNVPTIPLPDEKLVREEAIRNDVIKDLIEENDIIKDALMQGSESQRDVIKDAIKDVIGSNTEKSLIRVRSDIIKDTGIGVNAVKKSSQTLDKIKSIPTIPLPADKPKKKQESDDEIEEVWRKAVPGSSRRRSGEIKLNLLSDKARNNDKSKGQTGMKDYDIIGIQVPKKKEESQDTLNKIKRLFSDEDTSKNKNEIKKISETNQDKNPYISENKEKEKSQSHRDSFNESDGKQPKGTPKKETSNLYTEKKSDIPGLDLISPKKRDSLDLISPKKRDSLDIELPTERKRTFSRSFGDDDDDSDSDSDSDSDYNSSSFKYTKSYSDNDFSFKSTPFNINKIIDCEMEKQTKEDRDLIKRQKREMEKERKVAECIKAFHRHKGILDSEDEQEDKDSIDIMLDLKAKNISAEAEKLHSSTHGLVDNFVLQNNPDLKDNSEDEDKPYSPSQSTHLVGRRVNMDEDKPYSPSQSTHLVDSDPEIDDDIPYSPTQHVPDEVMPVPKPSSPGPPNKRMQNPVSSHDINKSLLESKVIEEVKKYLDPYYRDKTFNREQYKQIVSKCVDKVVNVECGYVIESFKMQKLVDGYVKLFKHRMKKERMLKL